MTTMYKFSNEGERRIAGAGIAEIVGRVYSMGQFTAQVNETWRSKEKKALVEVSVDTYMEELLRIGFSIELSDEEEED